MGKLLTALILAVSFAAAAIPVSAQYPSLSCLSNYARIERQPAWTT